jgi:purine-binding chemotaxis protein CheW
VINVEKDDIENTPSFGVDLETDFILGLAKIENKVITLLDIDQILTSRQLVMLQDADSKKK